MAHYGADHSRRGDLPLATDMSKADALAYWNGPDDEIFVVEEGSKIVGTYHLRPNWAGPGAHVANIGYMTSSTAVGKGVGRRMVEHSLQQARKRGFKAVLFNFVATTNERAVGLYKTLASRRSEPSRSLSCIQSAATLMSS